MPRIWADTIDTHRRQVTEAILDATVELVAELGPLSVSMAAIAERAGIGRATLYKYFPDIGSILVAWHTRDFGHHFDHLRVLAVRDDVTLDDLVHFVQAQRHRQAEGAAAMIGTLAESIAGLDHGMEGAAHAQVLDILTRLLARLADAGEVRGDIEPAALARWLFHVVHAPAEVDASDLVRLLVDSLLPRPEEGQAPT